MVRVNWQNHKIFRRNDLNRTPKNKEVSFLLLSPEQLKNYRELGFVIIECPYPEAYTAAAIDAVNSVRLAPEKTDVDNKGNHYRLAPQTPDSYWCALDHSLPFLQMELHPEIIELARQLEQNEDIYFRNGGINELGPGRSFKWHRDSDQWHRESGEEYIEFMHYFNGSRRENGCLRVVPGSHMGEINLLENFVESKRKIEWGHTEPDQTRSDVVLPNEITLALTPKQLLVRSSKIFHCTWLNESDDGRLMHHWLFRPDGTNDHRFRFEEYLSEELMHTLSPQQRDILWLGRDFPISEKWLEERKREHGIVRWGII